MGDGPQVNSWVTGRRRAHQVIEGNAVQPRQGQQNLKVWLAPAGLQTGQGTDRHARGRRHVFKGEVPFGTNSPEPWADRPENTIKITCHTPYFAIPAKRFVSI